MSLLFLLRAPEESAASTPKTAVRSRRQRARMFKLFTAAAVGGGTPANHNLLLLLGVG